MNLPARRRLGGKAEHSFPVLAADGALAAINTIQRRSQEPQCRVELHSGLRGAFVLPFLSLSTTFLAWHVRAVNWLCGLLCLKTLVDLRWMHGLVWQMRYARPLGYTSRSRCLFSMASTFVGQAVDFCFCLLVTGYFRQVECVSSVFHCAA